MYAPLHKNKQCHCESAMRRIRNLEKSIMKKILYILFILAPFLSFAQQIVFEQEQYPFPVTFYGVEPQLGFMNANAYYHHDFADIDGDGDYEIILGAGSQREYLFENTGNQEVASFQLINTQIVVPTSSQIIQAPVFCDIDNDNDLDLFVTDAYGGIAYYENTGNPDIYNYVLVDSTFENINGANGSVADFADIDDDGDYDLFIGNYYGFPESGRIYYYKNIGSADSVSMLYMTEYFENIDVGEEASPEFCDIDGDEDFDLFIGCDDGTVWYYENIGTPDTFDFEYITDNYNGIDVGNSSVPRFCDIDNDGDLDLFVANESAGFTNDFEGDISFYRNIGTSTEPNWEFVTGQYLFMDMSDRTSPNVIDIDDDGLCELLVGIVGGQLIYFENEGAQTEPSFCFVDSAYLGLDLSYTPVLSFGDLDNDNDLDFVVHLGGFTSYIDTYRNIGTISEPEYEFWETIVSTGNPDSAYSGVDLCDIDNDGDFDLFISDIYNALQFWENIGSNLQPRFRLSNDNFLSQPIFRSYNYQRFSDFDNDNDYDLIIGHNEFSATYDGSYLLYWENIGDQYTANFVPVDTIAIWDYPDILQIRPCLADIDGDGDDDMFVGEGGGAMLFFRNMGNNSVNGNLEHQPYTFTLYPNYPNPFNATTVIPFALDRMLPVKVTVYNQLGQVISTLIDRKLYAGSHEISWDAGGLSSGVYLVNISAGTQSANMKTILIK